eukprot:1884689-Pyramimonas_sp.AAC.1
MGRLGSPQMCSCDLRRGGPLGRSRAREKVSQGKPACRPQTSPARIQPRMRRAFLGSRRS